jgi:hypothetical protein
LFLGGAAAYRCGRRFVVIAPLEFAEKLAVVLAFGFLLLGGAALQRCDKRFVLTAPLGAEVALFAEGFFPQPLQPNRTRLIKFQLLAAERHSRRMTVMPTKRGNLRSSRPRIFSPLITLRHETEVLKHGVFLV